MNLLEFVFALQYYAIPPFLKGFLNSSQFISVTLLKEV